MPHLTKAQIEALPSEQLTAIVASTVPTGIYAAEYEWARDEVCRRLLARTRVTFDREAWTDAQVALDDDPTGQDCEDQATRFGCGADDTFDKTGARRLSRQNEAGEYRW